MTRRLKEYFLRGPRLGLHFMLTPRALACLSAPVGGRHAAPGRSVLPLPPGSLAPSFEASNVRDAGALGRLVREAVREAGGSGREASLLLPEASQKSFVLSFEGLPPSAEERRELVLWRLKRQMPSLPEDIRLSFDAAENGAPRRVFASLARASVVREYEDLFSSCGIKLRSVGLPTLGLLNLLDRQRERDILLANIEEDSVSLLVLLDGRPALFRFKPFLAGKTLPAEQLAAAAAKEVSGTLRFLEDREKKTVKSVWVRSGTGGEASQVAAGLQAGTALPVGLLDPSDSFGLKPRERHFLGPLLGQAS